MMVQMYYCHKYAQKKPTKRDDSADDETPTRSIMEQLSDKNGKYYLNDDWQIVLNENYKSRDEDDGKEPEPGSLEAFKKEISKKPYVKQFMEKFSKVHYNSHEPEKFGAKAFTKGDEIHIAPGQEDTLDHELAHVCQQMEGKVKPTGKINGEKVNTDPNLEKEADEIAKSGLKSIDISASKSAQTSDVMQFVFDPNLPGWAQEHRRDYYKAHHQERVEQGIARAEADQAEIDSCQDVQGISAILTRVLSQYWPPGVFYETSCSLEGVNLELAKANAKQLIGLCSRYSTSIRKIKMNDVTDPTNRMYVPHAAVDNSFETGRNLILGENFFQTAEEYRKHNWDRMREGRFADVLGEEGAEEELLYYPITHEFGHSLLRFSELAIFQNGPDSQQMVSDIQRLFDEYKANVKIKSDVGFISTYAKTNIEDFIAECFAQAELSSHPSSYAREVMRILNEHFAWNKEQNLSELESRWSPVRKAKAPDCVIC
jgi:hypothetical protein